MTELVMTFLFGCVCWVWGGISQARFEKNREGYVSVPEVCIELMRRARAALF